MSPKGRPDNEFSAIDQDTTAVAEVVDAVRNKIKLNMTEAEAKAIDNTLAGVSARLKATGHDPKQPVLLQPMPVA